MKKRRLVRKSSSPENAAMLKVRFAGLVAALPPPIPLKKLRNNLYPPKNPRHANGLGKNRGGAPRGNRNARRHGAFGREARARRAAVRALLARMDAAIDLALVLAGIG